MNNDYDACRSLYDAARLDEKASLADRRAVRLALLAAVSAGVHVAASTAMAAPLAPGVAISAQTSALGVSAVGIQAVGAQAVGAQAVLKLVLGGKFLSGLICGVVLGSAVVATAVAVGPTSSRASAARPGSLTQVSASPGVSQPHRSVGSKAVVEPMLASDPMLEANAPALPVQSRAVDQGSKMGVSAMPVPLAQRQLAEETVALAAVQDALSQQDAVRALALIDQQKRQYASGQLTEERAAAEVIALCSAGRSAEADTARGHFTANYPNSPLTKRVTIGCSQR